MSHTLTNNKEPFCHVKTSTAENLPNLFSFHGQIDYFHIPIHIACTLQDHTSAIHPTSTQLILARTPRPLRTQRTQLAPSHSSAGGPSGATLSSSHSARSPPTAPSAATWSSVPAARSSWAATVFASCVERSVGVPKQFNPFFVDGCFRARFSCLCS